jgi:hypothetical protein
MSEFTPGPWEPVRSLTCGHLRAGHNYNTPEPKKEWTDADIRLIAAAPELYEACDECLHALRTLIVYGELSDGSIDYLEKKLNAALDKADGEQKARGE